LSCTYTLRKIVLLFIIKFLNFTAKRWMKGGARHRGARGRGRGRGESRGSWRKNSQGGNRGNSRKGSGRDNRRGFTHNINLNFTCYY